MNNYSSYHSSQERAEVIEDLWTRDNRQLETWRTASTPDLIIHIIDRYHLEARQEMARLETLAEQAVLLEGADQPALVRLRDQVARFCLEVRAHLAMEERRLFPWMLDLDRGCVPEPGGALLPALKKLLEEEHEAETRLFWRLRCLTADAAQAAGTGTLLARVHHTLWTLEQSMHDHMFLENQILFRRLG
jgi:regulator of cell morphogenesis and NO signaling